MNDGVQPRFINRELSWLEFNGRVLEEAMDPANPLLERLRFYCIVHSNLDEFYMVRVASLYELIDEGHQDPDSAGLTPGAQLDAIREKVRRLCASCSALYHEDLLPALARQQIRILPHEELSPAQVAHLDWYFEAEVYPVLTPVAINEASPFPHLHNLAVNLGILLRPGGDRQAEPRLAIVQVPRGMPGLRRLPDSGDLFFYWLIDIIKERAARLFYGYEIVEAAGFRLTRDARVELDDEGWDDYMGMLETKLRKRQRARPMRLEYESGMSADLLKRIQNHLGVEEALLVPVRGPLDPRPLLTLADMPGYEHLHFRPQPPLGLPVMEEERSIFQILRDGDLLLHHPYDSFDPVIEFLHAAAEDPDVLAVKQILYRTSGAASPVLHALMRAARNGKEVTVLIELTARFDEERNIHWARDLEQAGAHVLYGLFGLKAHAKIALVVRREPDGIRRYVHLGTGNYNEKTARLYTDFGLLTAAGDIGREASGFFNAITGYSEPPMFQHLIMAPTRLRNSLLALIRREADWARSGQKAEITAKMNSLVDTSIIEELYRANQSGVMIRLNVRGICCLRPGVPGLSENIRVISILDRYLEHGRAFVFHNGGDPEVYLASADWMPRNLDRRVELMFPLVEEAARAQENLYQSMQEERNRIRSIPPARFIPLERKEP